MNKRLTATVSAFAIGVVSVQNAYARSDGSEVSVLSDEAVSDSFDSISSDSVATSALVAETSQSSGLKRSKAAAGLDSVAAGYGPAMAAAVQGASGLGTSSSARSSSYTVSLNQDSFFGFNPSFTGLIPVNDTMDVAFYGTFWTKPAFGLGQGNSGDDLWTEFGVGVNFNLDEGRLKIKPQIGFTNGSLLSGGALVGGTSRGAKLFDGIVPSLTVNYNGPKIEAEYYGGYYAALNQRGGNAALDFIRTWVNVGYKATSNVSFGPHYEILHNSRNTYPGGSTGQTYEWLGGYVQFSLPKGFFARFTGGADLNSANAGDFYKMSIGMSF